MTCSDFRAKANHRITIQEMSNSSDDYGGQNVSWITQSTVWAAVEPLTGREVWSSDQNNSRVNSKMVIRYQADLKNTASTGAYRVSYDGRIFPIKYVKNVDNDMKREGKSFQILYCEEHYPSEA